MKIVRYIEITSCEKKRLFTDNTRGYGVVVLNWHVTPEREFTFFAKAFYQKAKESAEALHFGLHRSPAKEFRAYPVVFLYRHALEFHMKVVILIGTPMLRKKNKPTINRERLLKTHSIEILRQDFELIFYTDAGTSRFKNIDCPGKCLYNDYFLRRPRISRAKTSQKTWIC